MAPRDPNQLPRNVREPDGNLPGEDLADDDGDVDDASGDDDSDSGDGGNSGDSENEPDDDDRQQDLHDYDGGTGHYYVDVRLRRGYWNGRSCFATKLLGRWR